MTQRIAKQFLDDLKRKPCASECRVMGYTTLPSGDLQRQGPATPTSKAWVKRLVLDWLDLDGRIA